MASVREGNKAALVVVDVRADEELLTGSFSRMGSTQNAAPP